ncbi:MAG: PH domain-containing protein [Tomitella sp.]|nr:PH domain-containing protein [Tomitella sp.]
MTDERKAGRNDKGNTGNRDIRRRTTVEQWIDSPGKKPPRWLELGEHEHIIAIERTHPKALIGPALAAIVVIAAGIYLGTIVSKHGADVMDNPDLADLLGWAVPLVCGVVAIALASVAVGTWAAKSFTITDQRIIKRWGILSRTRRTVPVSHITETTVERSLIDRIVGAGTIRVAVAGGPGVQLRSIPEAQAIQQQIAAHSRRGLYGY